MKLIDDIDLRIFWWKSYIPPNTIDPISLEPLCRLMYPPFALAISQPYHIIDWPLPIVIKTPYLSFHLFDGFSLAKYLISQCQFIDPLNRRRLVREEVCHLDAYLRRHNFYTLNIIKVFDENNNCIPKASDFSQSEEGKIQIYQQEEQDILESIFSRDRITVMKQKIKDTYKNLTKVSSGKMIITKKIINIEIKKNEGNNTIIDNNSMNRFPAIRNTKDSLVIKRHQIWNQRSEMNYEHIRRKYQQDQFPVMGKEIELNSKKHIYERKNFKLSSTLKIINMSQKSTRK